MERKIAEYGLRNADSIIVQTRDQARMLHSDFGLSASMIVHNFHPLPEATLRADRDGKEKLRVIWVANFKPSKNPEIFVDLAAANITNPDVEFIMIGRPGTPRLYRALHERIEHLGNLRHLGELPIERVNEEIAASDVFVNTSSSEGFPNTFIQAWLRAVPVVSCWVDPDECLSRHGAGILAGSAENLATAIDELRTDRDRLRALSQRAREHGEANHRTDQAEPLIELLVGRKAEGSTHRA
jgi:glycosyltransferase involved in cell wall biosynthesis